MEKHIYKPNISENIDQDVPEFGGYSNEELRYPAVRVEKEDSFNGEAYDQLINSALNRGLYVSYGMGLNPHLQFPNGEHFQHIPYSHEHWEKFGNMESEYSRIHFMLENYTGRRFPKLFEPKVIDLLSQENVLDEWNHVLPDVKRLSGEIYQNAVTKMRAKREYDPIGYKNGENGAYISAPVFYDAMENPKPEIALYDKALQQLQNELLSGNSRSISSFLSLYNRIKDPVTSLRSTLSDQVEYFLELYLNAREKISDDDISSQQEKILISQLALESSFLALPDVKNIACLVYGGHHELPYIYVDIARLPRGEFANPNRVGEVIGELIQDSKMYDNAVATPITVSYFQEPHQAEPRLFIVDGNNRSTAMLLMKYFDYSGYNSDDIYDKSRLRSFIELYDLDIEWERDLVMALKEITPKNLSEMLENKNLIKSFAHGQAPALLVQEPNFHTVAVAQSTDDQIILLQPMHQAIYNQSQYSMAIPSKQQSHGRAGGNDIRISVRRTNEKI